jgi:DNA-directed RNA polymerase specialized sigma24 family protein
MTEPMSAPVRRARRPDWKPRFLEIIRATGNVRLAASAAGIDRSTPYRRAQRDPVFARDWAAAEQDAIDALEAEARRRALASSDQLLMFLLRAHRPERYRETLDLHVEFRAEAERIAAKVGKPVEEVLALVERRVHEMEHR